MPGWWLVYLWETFKGIGILSNLSLTAMFKICFIGSARSSFCRGAPSPIRRSNRYLGKLRRCEFPFTSLAERSASRCWKIFIENIAIFVEKNIDQCATDFPVMSSVSQLRPKVWAKSRGWEREADKKLFLPQIVRYKVASVNKTVQTYQQGSFSTRHVQSLQTNLMSIMRDICCVKKGFRANTKMVMYKIEL